MENWRQFKEAKKSPRFNPPADGMSPVDPSVYDVHAGGKEGDTVNMSQLKGAPIKQRRQISVYPKPGTLYNKSTGEVDQASFNELMDIIDQDKDLMMSSNDPYVDDWLERTHAMVMDAIQGLREKGEAELTDLDATLDAEFASAIDEIREIIKARQDDTLDISDPRAASPQDTIPGYEPEVD